jgi:hypothetical protein
MSGINFQDNAATEDGGLFYIYSQLATPSLSDPFFDIQISSSTFKNTFAEKNGGSFYI